MRVDHHDDDDVEEIVIPVRREDIGRLARLAKVTGKHPAHVAADLLADLLADDEAANVGIVPGTTLN